MNTTVRCRLLTLRLGVAAGSMALLSACGATPDAAPPVVTVSSPSPKVTPTPTLRDTTVAEDLADARRAVMTVAVLGKPWVQPKKVNSVGGKAQEACPGKPSIAKLAPPRASYGRAFTKGTKPGASIGSFTVSTLTPAGIGTYRAAWTTTTKACATFKDASGLYEVTTSEGPKSLAGADEVLSRAERIYYDAAHKKLAYARHFISARSGRTLSTVEFDFLTTAADPDAKDFGPTVKLLTRQLARTTQQFGE